MFERLRTISRLESFICLLILIGACEIPAKAYIDPGSSSLVWQVVMAAVAGWLFYYRRIARWIRGQWKSDGKE
jgi:hypothetical protein